MTQRHMMRHSNESTHTHTQMTQTAQVSADLAYLPPVPMKRAGRPEEIADVAVFLCSEGASFVNGATWPVDGGYSIV